MAKKSKGPDLYMVIDVTDLPNTRILYVATLQAAAALGRIRKADNREVIAPPIEGRSFAKLSQEQLQYLFWNTTQTAPSDNYETLCRDMLAAAEALPVDTTPLEDLEREVQRLYPDDATTASLPKAEKKAREPRAPGEPHERPKATSTTGRVWEIADAQIAALCPGISPANVDWKALRTVIVAACEAEGINKATAATQYSKFKASKLSAKAA